MSRRFLSGVTAMLVVTALLLSACGGGTGPGTAPADPPQPSGDQTAPGTDPQPAQRSIKGEYTIHIPADPDILNPYFGKSAYGGAISTPVLGWGGLLMINEKNEPAPYFAKEWQASSDNLVWTFTLRDDVTFHDGKPLTAADVAFSYNIPLDPDYVGSSKSAFNVVKEVKAVDQHTVEITLKEPYAPFLFTTVTYPVLPSHAFPAGMSVKDMPGHEFSKKPIGAGPYRFVEWRPGQYVTLEAYPEYFEAAAGKGPFLKTFRAKIIEETQTAIAALEAGELDAYDSMSPQFVNRFRTEFADRLNAYDWDRNGFGFMTLNNERFPTSEKVVRQAMSMALNKPAILAGPLENLAKVPAGPIPPVSWAADPSIQGWPHDPERAKKLLEDAGYRLNANGIREKDGKPLVIDYYATKGHPLIEAIALQAQKDWSALGMEVNVHFVDFNILLEKHMEPGNFNVTFSGFSLGVDPDSFYNIYHSSSAQVNDQGLVKGNNVARYRNPVVDELLEQGRRTMDIEKRKQIYSDFQRRIIDDAPHIWIYANLYTDFVAKRIKGVINRPGYGASYWYRWYTEA